MERIEAAPAMAATAPKTTAAKEVSVTGDGSVCSKTPANSGPNGWLHEARNPNELDTRPCRCSGVIAT